MSLELWCETELGPGVYLVREPLLSVEGRAPPHLRVSDAAAGQVEAELPGHPPYVGGRLQHLRG